MVRTMGVLTMVALLGACAATPGGTSAQASPTPAASSTSAAVGSEQAASAEPEAVTFEELVASPQAYEGREVILTATTVREIAPSAWLIGARPAADATLLMLENDLHPVAIGKGDTFEIHATVEHFTDPDSMSSKVGALPDMYGEALTGYQDSYVLVATELSTSGA